MKTLSDAWNWYVFASRNLERMNRLGRKYWDDFDWNKDPISRDDEFRTLLTAAQSA
jgi:hypothetical protein